MRDDIFSAGLNEYTMNKIYDLFVPSIAKEVDNINNTNSDIIKRFKNEAVRMQIIILMEECSELIQALSKMQKKKQPETVENMIEEIAHVCVSIAILSRCFYITEYDIEKFVNEKVKKYLNDAYGVNSFKEVENGKEE